MSRRATPARRDPGGDRADAPIEFVAPRLDAFGTADDPGFVGLDGVDEDVFDDQAPRSPWSSVLAGLAVAGLFAGGVVAAAPWADDAAAPPPTTVPVTTTPASAITPMVAADTDDPLLPDWLEQTTGWLPADERTGFEISSAASIDATERGGDPLSLWMTEGATRTAGRWLAVDAIATDAELQRGGTVIDIVRPDGTWPAVVSVEDDGVVEMTVDRAAPDRPSFTLVGFGWTLDDLLVLSAGIEVGPTSIEYDDRLVDDGGPLTGMVEVFAGITTARPGAATPGPERAVTWLFDDRSGSSATVSVSALTMPAVLLTDLLSRRPVDERSLRRSQRSLLSGLAAAGRVVSLFELVADPGVRGASWFDGRGNEVAVLTDAGTGDLIDLVAALRPASDDEWTDALRAQRIPSSGGELPTMIGGSIQDGWSVQVADRQMWLNAGDGFFADRWPEPGRRAGTVYANASAAYLVLADTTRGSVDGRIATAALVEQGDTAQQVELVPLADGTRGAALPVDPRQPVTIRWLDPDGTVLNVSD